MDKYSPYYKFLNKINLFLDLVDVVWLQNLI